jgi:hypothetical protein
MSAKIVSTIFANGRGAIAQLGERLLCKQEVAGSIPAGSTTLTTSRPNQHERAMTGSSSRDGFALIARCLAHRVLFNNLEVLILTLSFQANVL